MEKWTAEHAAALDTAVERFMEAELTPGLTLSLTDRKGTVYCRHFGYSDLKSRSPVDDRTLFQIGSISKTFTALALLSHMAEKKAETPANGSKSETGPLSFDPQQLVTDIVPWFEVRSSFAPIRVHHLLSHTAGLPANRDDILGSLNYVFCLRDQKTAWAPGEKFWYSNCGYQAVHVVLETVSQKDYSDVIRETFFEPLGMTSSNPTIRPESRADQACGYIPAYDDRPAHTSRPLVEAPFIPYAIGDGCIQSTAADMARFARLLLNKGVGPDGQRVVSEEVFDLFSTPHIRIPEDDDVAYGYGIEIDDGAGDDEDDDAEGDGDSDETDADADEGDGDGAAANEVDVDANGGDDDAGLVLSHSGGMVGLFSNLVADLTNGVGVVVMANGPADLQTLSRYALDLLRAAISGDKIPEAPQPDNLTRIENAADFAGEFRATDGSTLVFRNDGEQVLLGEIPLERMIDEGEDVLYTPHPKYDRYMFRFERDDSGSIVEVTHGSRWFFNERYSGPVEWKDPPLSWQAYIGSYRSHSHWFPFLETAMVKDELVLITGEGGESTR
jgi:D-alanyl-D-alanine carboxypeptidase